MWSIVQNAEWQLPVLGTHAKLEKSSTRFVADRWVVLCVFLYMSFRPLILLLFYDIAYLSSSISTPYNRIYKKASGDEKASPPTLQHLLFLHE